jgi:hypothetical protein
MWFCDKCQPLPIINRLEIVLTMRSPSPYPSPPGLGERDRVRGLRDVKTIVGPLIRGKVLLATIYPWLFSNERLQIRMKARLVCVAL